MHDQLTIRRPEVKKRINFGDTKQKNKMLDAFRLCHSSLRHLTFISPKKQRIVPTTMQTAASTQLCASYELCSLQLSVSGARLGIVKLAIEKPNYKLFRNQRGKMLSG